MTPPTRAASVIRVAAMRKCLQQKFAAHANITARNEHNLRSRIGRPRAFVLRTGLSSRRAFTLMEVMIALTITGLVAALSAAALRAGIDVRERVQAHRATVETEARALTWIGTMLRHSPPASAVDEPMLTVRHSLPNTDSDELSFLSKGVQAPLGTGPVWRVSLMVQRDGLHIYATPVNPASNLAPLGTVLPDVSGLRIDVLDRVGGTGNVPVWRADWPVLRSMPRALRIRFAMRNGTSNDGMVFAVGSFSGDGN